MALSILASVIILYIGIMQPEVYSIRGAPFVIPQSSQTARI